MIACHMSNERVIFTDKSSVNCVDLTFFGDVCRGRSRGRAGPKIATQSPSQLTKSESARTSCSGDEIRCRPIEGQADFHLMPVTVPFQAGLDWHVRRLVHNVFTAAAGAGTPDGIKVIAVVQQIRPEPQLAQKLGNGHEHHH